MSVLDVVRLMIYRVHEQGLEIFLINNEMESDPSVWKLPSGANAELASKLSTIGKDSIDIDQTNSTTGELRRTIAIEGDWHDIPSIRGMVKHDIKLAKKIMKEHLPGSEKGGYFAVKEAFKKVMPHEYEAMKELVDIIKDRNTAKNI